MTKPFLIIQLRPEDETSDNEFQAIMHYGRLCAGEVKRLRIESTGLPAIDLDQFAAIIVGGSPFDVSTPPDQKSPIQRQIESGFNELFAAIVQRDFPFLGCCSGNGLLGAYCGASVSTKYGEPVGGVDIDLTDEGKADPLTRNLPSRFRALTGHKEACDFTPPECVLLATNTDCPVQMFRLRHNIYATQFHPEADAAGFGVRIRIYRNHGYFPAAHADNLIEAVSAEHVEHAHELLLRFVTIYRNKKGEDQ